MTNCTVHVTPLPVARAYLTKWVMSLSRDCGEPANEKELSMLSLTDLYRRYQGILEPLSKG